MWRNYFDGVKRAMEIYLTNSHGLASVVYQLNIEGWPFRTRESEPRAILKEDVRRIIANWPEYGGVTLAKSSKKRNAHDLNSQQIRLIPERSVLPLDLLEAIAKVQHERSRHVVNHGVKRHVRTCSLNGMTLCAHCERLAVEQNNPLLRSRLVGHIGRYRHRDGRVCGCTNRSVDAETMLISGG